MLIAAAPQGGQFRLGVDRADLRGVGDIDQLGEYHVFSAAGVERQYGFHHGRRYLAVRRIGGADLVAGGLNGAGLVAVDVAGMGGDHRFIGLKQGGDDRQVGLGTAYQKVNLRLRGGAESPNQVPGFLADGIQTVAAGLDQIGVRQCLKDGDMETLKTLVPETTLRYFESPEAVPVIEKIRAEANVIHY